MGSSDIAVAFEPGGEDTALAIAYRLLRCALVQDTRESPGGEVDREAHERVVSDIHMGLGKLDMVRAQHQAAINSITKATGAVNEVSHAVLRGRADGCISTAGVGSRAGPHLTDISLGPADGDLHDADCQDARADRYLADRASGGWLPCDAG